MTNATKEQRMMYVSADMLGRSLRQTVAIGPRGGTLNLMIVSMTASPCQVALSHEDTHNEY